MAAWLLVLAEELVNCTYMENWIRLDTGERKSGCSVSKDEDEEGAFVSMGVNTLSFKSLTRGITPSSDE